MAYLLRVQCLDNFSPLSVTSKVSDGWGFAFSEMMLCTKSALDVSFSCVHEGSSTCAAFPGFHNNMYSLLRFVTYLLLSCTFLHRASVVDRWAGLGLWLWFSRHRFISHGFAFSSFEGGVSRLFASKGVEFGLKGWMFRWQVRTDGFGLVFEGFFHDYRLIRAALLSFFFSFTTFARCFSHRLKTKKLSSKSLDSLFSFHAQKHP